MRPLASDLVAFESQETVNRSTQDDSDRTEGGPQTFMLAGRDVMRLGLLRLFKGIDLDAEVSHRAFDLRVSEEQLHSAQVLSAPVASRKLRYRPRFTARPRMHPGVPLYQL